MGQYCFARWRLSSSVTLPAGGRTNRRARGRCGGRHCTAGQYGYVPLGRHLVIVVVVVVYVSYHICTRDMHAYLCERNWGVYSIYIITLYTGKTTIPLFIHSFIVYYANKGSNHTQITLTK